MSETTSRSTWREPAEDVAYQRQLRERYADEPTPPVPHLDVGRARVKPVRRDLAEQIILKYEWLGTMAQSSLHYGIFFGMYCAGVVCIAAEGGSGARLHRSWGLKRHEYLQLVRGACVHWAPPNTNSKLISWACKLLERDTVGKLLVAYADTDAGEIGTVYQAANWTYIGRGASLDQWISPNGRIYDFKLPWDLARRDGRQRQEYVKALKDAGWKQQPSNAKHRYVWVLDRSDEELVRLVEEKAQPYPKRSDL